MGTLAARTSTPGGGSASALVGALGVALGEMVTRFSGPAGALPADAVPVLEKLTAARAQLERCVEDDSLAYDGVRLARKMMKNLPNDEGARGGYLKALNRAAEVPLSIALEADAVRRLLQTREGTVKEVMRSDYDAAMGFLRAAIDGAVANVRINIVTLRQEGVSVEALEASLKKLETGA
ncbi:MAG: cyclodeaminase/cyclohydrolase family protein [Candidatus Thermoplasmatota archaeon]|nr:cyclodeaminase/cyclohydrolase family protein [Candidatus Thermoplasmatota archaeon]